MTSDELIDQLEFRWVPQRGYSAIADSRGADPAFTKVWSPRLAALARHPDTPDAASPGTPAASLVYLRFESDHAAILWREWRRDAAPLGDSAERHPFVCRAFVGPARTLRPGTALAMCRAGLPAGVQDNPPGFVRPRDPLPVLKAGDFDALRSSARAALGEEARAERGLSLLIAAALREPEQPLSVILPERETCAPLSGAPQVSLLWGLFRVLMPLLDGIRPESRHGAWSFSTYEPPHDDKQSSELPYVVFRYRHRRGDASPRVYRQEAVARPRDEAERRAAADEFGVLGACLAAAYADRGKDLARELTDIARRHADLRGRLDEVRARLRRYYEWAQHAPVRPQPTLGREPVAGPEPVVEPEPVDQPRLAGQPGDVTTVPQLHSPAAQETARDEAPVGPHGVRPPAAGAAWDDAVDLYRLLPRRRGTLYFDVTVMAIRCMIDSAERIPPAQSAPLRQQFVRDGWYVDELRRGHRDLPGAAEALADLLRPLLPYDDDHLQETVDELARWVGPEAPPELLAALMLLCTRAPRRAAAELQPRIMQRVIDAIERQPPPRPSGAAGATAAARPSPAQLPSPSPPPAAFSWLRDREITPLNAGALALAVGIVVFLLLIIIIIVGR
jgi:hypothetical protein